LHAADPQCGGAGTVISRILCHQSELRGRDGKNALRRALLQGGEIRDRPDDYKSGNSTNRSGIIRSYSDDPIPG
jgi:hypothetical protein